MKTEKINGLDNEPYELYEISDITLEDIEIDENFLKFIREELPRFSFINRFTINEFRKMIYENIKKAALNCEKIRRKNA